ncbi:MAG: alpha/beta hydrolase [Candidatus Kapaibacteriota bacterium]|jgi:predicted esterase
MKSILALVFLYISLTILPAQTASQVRTDAHLAIKLDTILLVDSVRKRPIPVAFYQPKTTKKIPKQQLLIFSHGYGANKGGDNVAYSYLTEFLASKGYFVASIQHELPTDSLMPTQGVPQVVRKPFWERGVENILFVMNSLRKSHPNLDFTHITLSGHSNGGDMTALFAQKYPERVTKIITLDNRRVALPRTTKPRVYSLRSSDQAPDEGVVPTLEEQKKFTMTIIKLPNTIHNNMDDNANAAQRKEIQDFFLRFLKER